MPDFNQLLSTKMEDVKAPPPIPAGTYSAVIQSYELLESSQKKTPFVRFWIRPTDAKEDVDATALQAYGDLSKAKLRKDFFLTEDAFYRLKQFLEETLGIDGTGKTFNECLAQTTGASVVMSVKQSLAQDNVTMFSEIGSLAKAA